MTSTELIPAGITTPALAADSARNGSDEVGALWERISKADWSSNMAAYVTAADALRIIDLTKMTHKAFAAECRMRKIAGFGSQASVTRRLRWAVLHDAMWAMGTLPQGVFISEAASRPLFDAKLKLTKKQRLELLAELFGPHMTDEQKAKLAAKLNEATMREHLARDGDSGRNYMAPRLLILDKVIAKLLAQGETADRISEVAHRLEDSARNKAAGSGAVG